MPTPINDPADYWDHYAHGVTDTDGETALQHAFGWTQYAGHGPGDELLGQPRTALELGSGRGDAVAALAQHGIAATGIDLSPEHCRLAHQTWGAVTGARYIHSDVIDFLTTAEQRWEAFYLIWGALWFTDPQQLLPLIHACLTPGGRLVFSHAPAVPDSYGIQGMYGNGFTGRQVWIYRWAYEPDTWAGMLHEHGFTTTNARIEPAPEPDHVGTLIVEARA